MSARAVNAEPTLGGPLALSVAMHAGLVALSMLSALHTLRGNAWAGSGGGAVNIGLVGSLPGVPLPRPAVVSTSRVVDPTKGLYKSEAKPVVTPPEATPLREFSKEKKRLVPSKPSKLLEDTSKPPPGAIPYGQGGAPNVPYTQFAMGHGGTQGGMELGGGSGGGFGARFPWYVEAVQRRISGSWLQSTIDPNVNFAPRVVVQFQIFRDGTARYLQVTQSSGNASVDRSALRAVQDSSPFPTLPGEYAGTYVSVEFWFEYHR